MSSFIVHISDLHLGKGLRRQAENRLNSIKNYILQTWGNKPNKPLIIITGDIVDDGRKAQFLRAKPYFEELSNAGFLLRLVPGNHDYGQDGNRSDPKCFEAFQNAFGFLHPMTYPLCESPLKKVLPIKFT